MGSSGMQYGPEVQYLPKDPPIEDVIYLLKRDGGVYIRNLIAEADIDQAYEEVKDRIDSDLPWDGVFMSKEAKRCPGVASRSPTYARTQMMNPVFQAVCDHFLTTRRTFWWGEDAYESVSKPYLCSTMAMRVGPGGRAQPLHRDDSITQTWHTEIDAWDDERDKDRTTEVSFFVAGSKFSKDNGGTQWIPKSHLWGTDRKTPPRESDCHHSTMNKGDGFIMLSSCYHGSGNNTTTDQYRLLFATLGCRGWIRQEENQFLAIPKEVARAYDEDIQRFIGYSYSDPGCGGVDYVDPIYALYPEKMHEARPTDVYNPEE